MVKIISLLCAFLLFLVGHVSALSLITSETIKEAQDYGKMNAQRQDFLMPWISYEEKSENLNDVAEHAYLYTPFLLMAVDARDKNLSGQSVSALDGEKIVADYKGLLSFSIILFGEQQEFAQNASLVLNQNKKTIKAYQTIVPSNAEKLSQDTGQSLFKAQCYGYFLDKDIELTAPVKLSLTTGDKKGHYFYFDLVKIK